MRTGTLAALDHMRLTVMDFSGIDAVRRHGAQRLHAGVPRLRMVPQKQTGVETLNTCNITVVIDIIGVHRGTHVCTGIDAIYLDSLLQRLCTGHSNASYVSLAERL
jgi:hypothetical protein